MLPLFPSPSDRLPRASASKTSSNSGIGRLQDAGPPGNLRRTPALRSPPAARSVHRQRGGPGDRRSPHWLSSYAVIGATGFLLFSPSEEYTRRQLKTRRDLERGGTARPISEYSKKAGADHTSRNRGPY